MNTKTAEEILNECRMKYNASVTNEENLAILRRNHDELIISPDECYKAMSEYASPLKKRIEELEAALQGCQKIMEVLNYPDTVKSINNILHPSTNGKQDVANP